MEEEKKGLNILQVCHKPPVPAIDGGCIAINSITQGLLESGHNVKVVAISTFKHTARFDLMGMEYIGKTRFESAFVNTNINPIDALWHVFSRKSYNVLRFYSKRFAKKLIKILEEETFDIIHLESVYTTPYIELIREKSKAKIIYHEHNIEYLIWQTSASNTKNLLKRFYLNHLSARLKAYEKNIINKVDGIACITQNDAKELVNLGCEKEIEVVPFGVNLEHVKSNKEEEYPSLFHLGSMDWGPNVQGVRWFLKKVWPRIHKDFPELKLYLAGRKMPFWLKKGFYPNVEIVGEVENAYDFMKSKGIMIVPLHSGSGVRVKIIEGMALGKPIIATFHAASGIAYTSNENIFIANTAQEFQEKIKILVEQPYYAKSMGEKANHFIETRHSIEIATLHLVKLYNKLLK